MERVPYDEFSMFHENAEEFGLPYGRPADGATRVGGGRARPSTQRARLGRRRARARVLHGGAQNAHTWDTVAMALGGPLVALDLPGHGHSDGGRNGSVDVASNAEDVAVAIRALAPNARPSSHVARRHEPPSPSPTRPPARAQGGAGRRHARGQRVEVVVIAEFINGPESFDSFDDLLARTIEYNPTRTESSLRRGILHNAEQREDGSWVWRYQRFRAFERPRAPRRPRAPVTPTSATCGTRCRASGCPCCSREGCASSRGRRRRRGRAPAPAP